WCVWIMRSVGGWMDEEVSKELLEKIRQAISTEAEGALEAHDLRTRHAGRVTFIEFHLVVPGTTSLADCTTISDRVEEALKSDIPDAIITIHVEPEHKAKHPGGVPVV